MTGTLPTAEEVFGKPSAEDVFGPPPVSDFAKVSKALLDRLNESAQVFGDLTRGATGKMIDAAAAGFGSEPLGLSDQHVKDFQDLGLLTDPAKGRGGPIRVLSEAIVRPVAAGVDAVMRAANAGVAGASSLFGSAVEKVSGDETAGKQAQREMQNFLNWKMLAEGGNLTRLEPGPGGTVEKIVGSLPAAEDFGVASKVLTGESGVGEAAVKRVYNDRGILPAEVAADAAKDVTIAEDLAIGRVPEVYGGELAPEPPKPSTALEPVAAGGGSGEPPKPPARTNADFIAGGREPVPFDEAQKNILDTISIGDHSPKEPVTFEKLYTAFVDDLNPFAVARDQKMAELGINELPISEDFYKLARLTRGISGKVDHFLQFAPYDFNTYANNGRSLKDILAPFADDLNGLRAYVKSKRGIELEARGLESGIDIPSAYSVIDGPKAAEYEQVHRALVGYQNKVSLYLRDAGVLSKEAYKAMVEANKDYVPYNRYFGPEFSAGGGTGAGLKSRNPIHAIKGSELATIDPIESIIKNTYTAIALAEKNAVSLKLIDLLKRTKELPKEPLALPAPANITRVDRSPIDVAYHAIDEKSMPQGEAAPLVEKVDNAKKDFIDAEFTKIFEAHGIESADLADVFATANRAPQTNVIHAFRDGKKETYRTSDNELFNAWKGLDRQTSDYLNSVLSMPSRWLRTGATMTPEFLIGNVIRDFQQAFLTTKGGIFSPLDTLKGAAEVVRKGEDYQNWLKGGGANAALVSMDRRYLQANIADLEAETGIMSRVRNAASMPIDKVRLFAELVENSTRLGEFKKVAGDPLNDTATGKQTIQAGALASREATLDFAKIGAQMRALNAIDTFLSANLNGIDKLVRTAAENPLRFTVLTASSVLVPSLLTWWANHDDQRYKDLHDWERDLNWIIITKDHVARIRKPPIVGLLGSFLERSLTAYFDENPKAYANFEKSMIASLGVPFIPTLAMPMFEQWANSSFLSGNSLVSKTLEKQLPEYRYNQYTTETAKAIGSILGAFPGMRDRSTDPDQTLVNGVARALTTPVLVENYIRAWTGGVGTYALQITDAALRKAGVLPDPPKPADTLADLPVIKAFMIRYPSANSKVISDFYEHNDKNAQVMATWQAQLKAGDLDAANKIESERGIRVQLDGVVKALGQMAVLARNIYKDPNQTPSDKRQQLDTLYMNMIEISRNGGKILDGLDKKREDDAKLHADIAKAHSPGGVYAPAPQKPALNTAIGNGPQVPIR